MLKPCLEPGCGEPSPSSRSPEHQTQHRSARRGSARQRGYTTGWDKLSLRARFLQPWCQDCGATEILTCDHKPSAWKRKAEGKAIRLEDVSVVCGPCNTRRGSSRPDAQGTRTVDDQAGPRGKAQSQLLWPPNPRDEVGGSRDDSRKHGGDDKDHAPYRTDSPAYRANYSERLAYPADEHEGAHDPHIPDSARYSRPFPAANGHHEQQDWNDLGHKSTFLSREGVHPASVERLAP